MACICFVSYEVHPTTAGGCGVLIHHAAQALLRRGHEVILLLDLFPSVFAKFQASYRTEFPNPGNLHAYRVADLCDDFACEADAVPTVFQRKSLRFAHALRKVSRLRRIDLVEFFDYCGPGYYAMVERLFAADAGPPGARPVLGVRAHGTIEVLDRHGAGAVADRDQFMLHSLERGSLSLAETVLVPTRTYYERYYRGLYGLEPSRVVVSPPPKEPFPRVTRRPAPGAPFSIVSLGRVFHLKGVDQLVHAAVLLMKKRPDLDFKVDVIGYDSREGPLKSYAGYLLSQIPARLRGRFDFPGQLTHERIAPRLEGALFAVFPNRVESFCYALHELYDAGLPVIANNLPAFADFFTHEQNALLYDGTTGGLLAAMERMVGDAALRERLYRPYPVAEGPPAGVYEAPAALRAVDAPPPGTPTPPEPLQPLVIVMGHDSNSADWPALDSLRRQTASCFRTVLLVPSSPDDEETLWWMSRSWHVRDAYGRALEASDVSTTDALLVLDAGDRLHPSWIATARRALERRPDLAFAGTWTTHRGKVRAGVLDLAPEVYPFEEPGYLPRVLLRSQPGVLLHDLLDPSLGALGVLGLVWEAIATRGHGVLHPQPLLDTTCPDLPVEPALVQALVMRHGGPFAERLALITGLRSAPLPTPPTPPPDPSAFTVESKVRIADELGGRTLAALAWKKLRRRAMGRGGA